MGTLRRRQDWPQRLSEAIESKADVRFSPGKHDCCISACDIVEQMTGTDIGHSFRDYSNKEEMKIVLDKHGGVESIAESIMLEYECPEILLTLAARGDMVMLNMPDGYTMGIVDHDGINAIACGTKGWESLPIKTCGERAWRIG